MTEDEARAELGKVASQWTGAPDMRICAVCLCETPRATYTEHMESHGYETLNVVAKVANG